jgi:crotonobetainyl-CoA:carnitine CoA-transferase CaiB-like acyl-CoA transferase
VPAYAKLGEVRHRLGADVPHVVPHGHWQTAEGKWVALACSSDKIFERMAQLMGQPELAAPDRFATNAQRLLGRAEINAAIAGWIGNLPMAEAIARCDAAGVPCGPIMSIDDIFRDPQYAARGNLQHIDDPRVGAMVVPSAQPRMSTTPPVLRHLGGALGADTAAVLSELLGLGATDLDTLRGLRAI